MSRILLTAARSAAIATAIAAAAVTASPALAAGKGNHSHGESTSADIGKPGKAAQASRTVTVVMHDNYYEPEGLTLKPGETVRFVVQNKGALVHEFSIATAAMHQSHAPEMQMMVEHGVLMPDRIDRKAAAHMQKTMGHGMHDEANSVLLEPGKSAEIVWAFPANAAGRLEFACNVPGHYDAGMAGPITLAP